MPPLPNHYLERQELDDLEDLVLGRGKRTIALVGKSSGIGVQGMGGIGKSVLAAALVQSGTIREAFLDGIIWLDIGQSPDLKEQQNIVIDTLGGETTVFEKASQGKRYLNSFLNDKSCLIILDDVWKLSHASVFNFANSKSRLLITTRDAEIVSGLDALSFKIDTLSNKQALALLRQTSGFREDRGLPIQAKEITKECGNLPLAIAMVGAMLRDKPHRRWQTMLERLQNSELEKIKKAFADYPYPNLFKAMHVSVEDLEPQLQERYLDFAVFPEDYAIPEVVLEILWSEEDLGRYDLTDVVDLLLDKSLLHRRGKNGLILHDLQYDYVRKQVSSTKALHLKLIQAYRKHNYKRGWEDIEDDGYYRKFIVHHLKEVGDESGAKEAAKALLLKADDLSPIEAYECFKVLHGKELKEVLQALVARNNVHVDVVRHALHELGSEVAEDAKRLIQIEGQHPAIVLEGLDILAKDAAEEAKNLLKVKDQNTQVILQCLLILGNGAKEDAKRLLQDSKDIQIVRRCLKLLGSDAEDFAHSLIKKSGDPQILLSCLEILGEEAKPEISYLIRRDEQNIKVIRKCLILLNNRDVEDLKWLLQNYGIRADIALKCLDLLGEEAKAEAKRLLEQSDNAQVIAKSVSLLGHEASGFAAEKLARWREVNPALLSSLFRVAVDTVEAEKASLDMLENWDSLPDFLKPLTLSLPLSKASALKIKHAKAILHNWKANNRFLVHASLIALEERPDEIEHTCRSIIQNWYREISYQLKKNKQRFDLHIIKALSHPDLRDVSTEAAYSMLLEETNESFSLTQDLRTTAKKISQETWPQWRTTF